MRSTTLFSKKSFLFKSLHHLCIHDPGDRAEAGLEADQVDAEPDQHHGGVRGGAVPGQHSTRISIAECHYWATNVRSPAGQSVLLVG